MNTAKQFMWFFFILIILACFGWYYNYTAVRIHLDHESLVNSVDTTILDVTVRQFNQEGALANLLSSPIVHHIPRNDVYLFQNPYITVHQKEQPPWDISAQKAQSHEGGKQITFIGNVLVHQKKENKSQESSLKTEEATYFPKEKKASSDVLVTYEQSGNIIQSIGMNAYLDEKRVELLHQARGRYAPTNG